MKVIVALALCLTLLFSYPTIFNASNSEIPTFNQIKNAYKFLISLYNPDLGLICESYIYPYNKTYWIYSDNLLCAYVLKTYAPYIANRINETVREYMLRPDVGMPHKFEVLFGYDIPDTFLGGNTYIIEETPNYTIKIDRADGEPMIIEDYADLCFYKALDSYLEGDKDSAIHYFKLGYNLFDGIGFYDKATKVDGLYANYKLALCLYTAKVLGLSHKDYPALEVMERLLWDSQNDKGGIITHRDLNGNLLGLANAETTALTLLIYNDTLIRSLNPQHNVVHWVFVKIIGIVVIIGFFLCWLFKNLLSWFH